MPNGGEFDDFLKEEGAFETTTAAAIQKVLALQIEEEIQAQHLTKTAMAQRMHTSRAALNRLLDVKDTSLTEQIAQSVFGLQNLGLLEKRH